MKGKKKKDKKIRDEEIKNQSLCHHDCETCQHHEKDDDENQTHKEDEE